MADHNKNPDMFDAAPVEGQEAEPGTLAAATKVEFRERKVGTGTVPAQRAVAPVETEIVDVVTTLADDGAETRVEVGRTPLTGDGHVARDPHDMGVPMLPGDPAERQGPEDALGEGPKRGDYTGRIGPSSYHPYTFRPGGEAVYQRPLAEQIGDEPGLKGGVDTDPDAQRVPQNRP